MQPESSDATASDNSSADAGLTPLPEQPQTAPASPMPHSTIIIKLRKLVNPVMRNPIRNINAPQYQAKRSLPDHFQKCIFVNEGDTERGGLVALRRAHVVAGEHKVCFLRYGAYILPSVALN